MKHGHFNEKNQLVDTTGTCVDCGKDYTLFRPCDCELKTMDDERMAKLDPSKISIAVITTFEGSQEVVKTASLAEAIRESYYLSTLMEKHPDTRPTVGYQGPEPQFAFGERESVSVNFFEIEK